MRRPQECPDTKGGPSRQTREKTHCLIPLEGERSESSGGLGSKEKHAGKKSRLPKDAQNF